VSPEERAAKVVNELDDLAREVDDYDYGLPIYGENMTSLVAVVAAAIREAVAAERENCATTVERQSQMLTDLMYDARHEPLCRDLARVIRKGDQG